MEQQEIIYTIALTRIGYFSSTALLQLYRELGSATAIFEHRNDIRDIIPDVSTKLVEALHHIEEPLKRAEIEMEYNLHHNIQALCLNDNRYPLRMRECTDAPLVVFYKGTADLNQQHIISIVGTRHCTPYGQDLIQRFIRDLRIYCPHILIVSGLAYGIDICAHRHALTNGFDTVAVLAHGLDDLYPSSHRETATQMINQGGLLTEFMTQTNADKMNFVKRNRIVAGMSDATILVESAAKGGGLITCSIAESYNRDVFAFPGRINDPYSEGCNNLIQRNGAALLTNAEEFIKNMGWQDTSLQQAQKDGIERQLFPDLSSEELTIINTLQKNNDLQLNILSTQTGISIQHLTALLFSLEMKGAVRTLAGGICHLLG